MDLIVRASPGLVVGGAPDFAAVLHDQDPKRANSIQVAGLGFAQPWTRSAANSWNAVRAGAAAL
ncbi:hypothetical protein BRAO375_4880016 [Bradyrhizobium sp. ORS 375]|nr:hypothetical protein BRAO375_4880016 [Bradyrhizobium sp. ORS 375]